MPTFPDAYIPRTPKAVVAVEVPQVLPTDPSVAPAAVTPISRKPTPQKPTPQETRATYATYATYATSFFYESFNMVYQVSPCFSIFSKCKACGHPSASIKLHGSRRWTSLLHQLKRPACNLKRRRWLRTETTDTERTLNRLTHSVHVVLTCANLMTVNFGADCGSNISFRS